MSTPTLDIPATDDPTAVPTIETPAPSADTLPEPVKAPRTTRTRAPRASKPRATGTRKPRLNIAASMAQLYTAAGLGVSLIPSPPAVGRPEGETVAFVAGQAILSQAEACGKAWEKAADESPAVREAIEKMLTVSVWGAVLGAHAPIFLAVAAAAGVVPQAFAGTFGGEPAQ